MAIFLLYCILLSPPLTYIQLHSSDPIYYGAIHKGRPPDPGGGGLRNPDVQLLFECDSIFFIRTQGVLEILVLAGCSLLVAPMVI